MRAVERRRPPEAVDVADRVRDHDLGVRRDLLEDQVHGEERGEVVGADRLAGAGMQHRLRRFGMSAAMLYQRSGIALSGRVIFVSVHVPARITPPGARPPSLAGALHVLSFRRLETGQERESVASSSSE